MSKFLKGLKGLIIEDTEGNKDVPPVQAVPQFVPQNTSEQVFNGNANTTITSVINTGEANPINPEYTAKFALHFDKLMADSDLPGPDYYEYKQALKNMSTMALDEATKYKMAYSTLKAMKLSREVLMTSTQEYLRIINAEKADFDKTITEQHKLKISEKQNGVQILNSENEEIQKQMVELNKRLSENMMNIEKVKSETTEITNKYETNLKSFNAVYNSLLSDIQNDVNKITTYITPDIA